MVAMSNTISALTAKRSNRLATLSIVSHLMSTGVMRPDPSNIQAASCS
jgi:hypothetical protein